MANKSNMEPKEYKLEVDCELRFEIETKNEKVIVEVKFCDCYLKLL